jgi:hypothetical protein
MKKLLLLAALIISAGVSAQTDRYWSPKTEKSIQLTGKRQIIPKKYLTFSLNGAGLKDKLFSAPNERSVKINDSQCIVTLPAPDGKMQQFRVVESPIMEPGLASQFPNIKTFSVKGIDDPYANGKLDWNEQGFHGMIRSVNGDFFIDPYCVANLNDYITYYTKDFEKDPSQTMPEAGVINYKEQSQAPKKKEESEAKVNSVATPASCVGALLRSYRLAVACTGEYAAAATGTNAPTLAQTLSKIVTSVNRVDGVYETEVAVRMVLVATETNVIFTDPNTDPFSGNNNANVLINESQTVITNTIGSANFDIGHTFSTGGGGLAGLGVVCQNSQKASGITGSPYPVGDPYDIDYVAHEMGHEFGGNHTFNANTGSCSGNRNAPTSVEPGSGITIMAYAGICGSNDLAAHSIAYFHAVSYDEIVNYINNVPGSTCSQNISSGNLPPVVTGSGNYAVPKSTAFVLTGSATDPDNDALTYSWEETTPGATTGNWNSGSAPYFMSYAPTTSPSRSFPNPTVVAIGNYTITKGEYVPPTAQTLAFRLTARDNKMGGGGVCYATNNVTIASSGPFALTYPTAAGITWYLNGIENIAWNVNGTNSAPVSCDSVRVWISYDSGTTYSVLLPSTPNDGMEAVPVPTVVNTISTCRIKIEGKGNIFYDMSHNDFTITNLTGIRQNSISNPLNLAVFPNPFNSELNIRAWHLNTSSPTELKICDMLGKNIMQLSFNGKNELDENLNLSSLSKGVYFITLTNSSRQSVYRVVKD